MWRYLAPHIPRIMAMANVRPIAAYTGGLKGQVCSLAYELLTDFGPDEPQ